jgi:ferredoxin
LNPSWFGLEPGECFRTCSACYVRITKSGLENIDGWRRKQDDLPGRPEAIRRLVELGLKVKK